MIISFFPDVIYRVSSLTCIKYITVEPLNKLHSGASNFVLYREQLYKDKQLLIIIWNNTKQFQHNYMWQYKNVLARIHNRQSINASYHTTRLVYNGIMRAVVLWHSQNCTCHWTCNIYNTLLILVSWPIPFFIRFRNWILK